MRNRVLITRSEARASALSTELLKQEVDVVSAPLTQAVNVVADIPQNLSVYNWIAFTSANGVRGFASALRRHNVQTPRECRMAAVGEATADAMRRELGCGVSLMPEQANGRALAEALLVNEKNPCNVSVLYPCAETSLPDFKATCEQAGIKVQPLVVYRTEPLSVENTRQIVGAVRDWDAIVFYAPSAVKTFAAAFEPPYPCEIIAAGATTAGEVCRAGGSKVWIASSPKATDVLAELLLALQCRNVVHVCEVTAQRR